MFNSKWSGYFAGAALAFMAILMLYLFREVIGIGDSLVILGQYTKQAVANGQLPEPGSIDWRLGFLGGIMIGGCATAFLTGNFGVRLFADCSKNLPLAALKSTLGGFIGGFLVMLGIQLSGESVFGQMIAAMELSGGAWIFLIAMTVTAALLAVLLEHKHILPDGSEK